MEGADAAPRTPIHAPRGWARVSAHLPHLENQNLQCGQAIGMRCAYLREQGTGSELNNNQELTGSRLNAAPPPSAAPPAKPGGVPKPPADNSIQDMILQGEVQLKTPLFAQDSIAQKSLIHGGHAGMTHAAPMRLMSVRPSRVGPSALCTPCPP